MAENFIRTLHYPEKLTQIDVQLSCCCTYSRTVRYRCTPQSELVYIHTYSYQSHIHRVIPLKVYIHIYLHNAHARCCHCVDHSRLWIWKVADTWVWTIILCTVDRRWKLTQLNVIILLSAILLQRLSLISNKWLTCCTDGMPSQLFRSFYFTYSRLDFNCYFIGV